MIGQHPELYGFPELKLFAFPTMGDLDASLPPHQRTADVAHRSPGLVRVVAQLVYGGQSQGQIGAAFGWLHDRAQWSGAEVLDALLERVRPRVGLEKSPEHASSRSALERINAAYPRARYIHLTRHPVAVVTSMQLHLQRASPHLHQDLATFCFYVWYEINFRVLDFTATLPAERYVRVRSEDILNESRCHLRRVARHLGLRDDTEAIASMLHPELSPYAGPGQHGSGARGGNDDEFLRDPRPRGGRLQASVDRPQAWNGPESLWSAVVELAHLLGYGAWSPRRDCVGAHNSEKE